MKLLSKESNFLNCIHIFNRKDSLNTALWFWCVLVYPRGRHSFYIRMWNVTECNFKTLLVSGVKRSMQKYDSLVLIISVKIMDLFSHCLLQCVSLMWHHVMSTYFLWKVPWVWMYSQRAKGSPVLEQLQFYTHSSFHLKQSNRDKYKASRIIFPNFPLDTAKKKRDHSLFNVSKFTLTILFHFSCLSYFVFCSFPATAVSLLSVYKSVTICSLVQFVH